MSPNAYTPSTLVFSNSSTSIYPLLLTERPVLARSSWSATIVRPIAYSTTSNPSRVFPFPMSKVFLPSTQEIEATVALLTKVTPAFFISSANASEMSASNVRSALGPRVMRVVSDPNALRMPAISTAIYPAPTTATLAGTSERSKKPSELIVCSMPGISGMAGFPPTAMQMCLALYTWPLHSTCLGPTNLAKPRTKSTLSLSRLLA
mmetsp:Transcript_33091/g.64921  ORF Transcript_33091/g.64921 Transcript_33091/m.64921 type:complete len:206 (-) Transcript_33091:314-931(-)